MGWGVLAGLGAGFSGAADSYGRIMDQKRTQDFQLKRDEVAFERQKALEDLRFQNQKKRDTTQRRHQVEDRDLARQNQLDDRETDKEDQLEVYEKKKKMDMKYGLELAKQTNEINKKYEGEAKEKKVQELQEFFMEDGELSFQEKLAIASVQTGQDLSGFYRDLQGKPMSADMFEQLSFIAMNNEKMMKLAKENPMQFLAEVKIMGDYLQERGSGGDSANRKFNRLISDLRSMNDADQLKQIQKIREENGDAAANMVLQALGKETGIEAEVDSGDDGESEGPSVWTWLNTKQSEKTEPPAIVKKVKSGMDKWKKAHEGYLGQ